MRTFSLLLLNIITMSLQAYASTHKVFDKTAVYCKNNLENYDKILKLKLLELDVSESAANLAVEISLLEDSCDSTHLDVAPSTSGSLQIQKYILTASSANGQLLYSIDLNDLLSKSKEKITIGLSKEIVSEKQNLEIGVQIQGLDSESIDTLSPVQKNLGAFNYTF